ncbi:hypothetical protein MXD62_28600 [Frankia sp. Mgl5]|uniref:hypothetical protein n=1 Tax=Frankia sp. Mgl5 TaxID=2933793 RepID=UPI00200FA6F6|nr:hypothetical protein [Frankia sp. Mgl5]MCK9931057.1 hypothetical protein [Frankia sp. Mgl5]
MAALNRRRGRHTSAQPPARNLVVLPPPATLAPGETMPAAARTALPPPWGWRMRGGGRAAHVIAADEFQGTTVQIAGLFPFVAGSGSPVEGVPVGRHMLWGETVCLDPLAWLRAGLTTNPGMFVLGQPGVGKSALSHRLITGMVAAGTRALILGDTKPDYVAHIAHLGGQIIKVGRGLDRINPLDAGPLGQVLAGMDPHAAAALRWEVRGRRLALLLALISLVRGDRVLNVEEVILGRAVDLLDTRIADPTVPDVLRVLDEGPDQLRAAARTDDPVAYQHRVHDLVASLALLCEGSLAGVFDGPTSTPIDLDAPAVSVDISRVGAAGDTLLAAALLCTWAYGHGAVDAAAALAEVGAGPRRTYLAVMDELWRALRGAPGLVEHADALTRLNRAKGMASLMITHSLADLDALATEEDRAKARGFVDRAAITVLAGLPPRELGRVQEITPLTDAEWQMIASWSAPDSWQPGGRHPGRGKYMIKTGGRLGIPVQMTLLPAEVALYDSDQAIRRTHPDTRR